MSSRTLLPSSFRDPAGFLFSQDNTLYRQVNSEYAEDYELLMSSGLYEALIGARLLIPHKEVDLDNVEQVGAYKVLQPDKVSTISYPFEWCFSQLKDAALTTIKIQRFALKYGMVLKDASAYNIQFHRGKATFIDTLSFSKYREGEPWVAYKQFCQHFFAPLALMSLKDCRLEQLFRVYIDGIPLDLASRLLPVNSYLRYPMLVHIHLHAKTQAKYADSMHAGAGKVEVRKIGRKAYEAFLQGIDKAIQKIHWKLPDTEWGEYYSATNYQDSSMQHKEALVEEFLGLIDSEQNIVHDLGANEGHFSRIAASAGYSVVSQDIDPVAVEKNYRQLKKGKQENILPLLLDLTNPSPSLGWSLNERMSFNERIEGKIIMALALIHHLAISNNVPLAMLASYFGKLASYLIIEFVPKSDSQVERLLASREDIFHNYTQEGFEAEFSRFFSIQKRVNVEGSERTLYLLQRKQA